MASSDELKRVVLDVSILRPAGQRMLVFLLNIVLFLDIAVAQLEGGCRLWALKPDEFFRGPRLIQVSVALFVFLLLLQPGAMLVRWAFLELDLLVLQIGPLNALRKLFSVSDPIAEARDAWSLQKRTHVDEDELLAYSLKANSSLAMQVYEQHKNARENDEILRRLSVSIVVLGLLDFYLPAPGTSGIVGIVWSSCDGNFPRAAIILKGLMITWALLALRYGLTFEPHWSYQCVKVGSSHLIRKALEFDDRARQDGALPPSVQAGLQGLSVNSPGAPERIQSGQRGELRPGDAAPGFPEGVPRGR